MKIPENGMNRSILVVDDYVDFLRFMEIGLKKCGFRVITVQSGVSALELLETEPVDLVLLDENMPDMNGLETFTHIKKSAAYPPVIMVTADDSLDLVVAFMREGGADFITKPVDLKLLETRILKALMAAGLKSRLAELEEEKAILGIMLRTVNNLSHEINNPLNSIFTAVGLMDKSGSDGELVDKIGNAMHRIHHVLLDLNNAVTLRRQHLFESVFSAAGRQGADV